MTKSHTKRKTRSDKFPLTLHLTGQYCKKIKGKLYYFGSDKKLALQRYLEQAVQKQILGQIRKAAHRIYLWIFSTVLDMPIIVPLEPAAVGWP